MDDLLIFIIVIIALLIIYKRRCSRKIHMPSPEEFIIPDKSSSAWDWNLGPGYGAGYGTGYGAGYGNSGFGDGYGTNVKIHALDGSLLFNMTGILPRGFYTY